MDFTAGWGWPQWALLRLMALTLLGHGVNHGKPREPHNGFLGSFDFALTLFILIAGGFFA